jgi:hypothetical protein
MMQKALNIEVCFTPYNFSLFNLNLFNPVVNSSDYFLKQILV